MNEVDRLKKIRKDRGISIEVMARDIGVSMLTLRNWLDGTYKPSLMALARIQEYLDKQDARPRGGR